MINTIISQSDTLTIRAQGRELYLESLTHHPIFGCGYPHEDCIAACNAAGFNQGIYLVDNGIFGFAYVYGLLGVGWLISLWIYYMRRATKLATKKANYMYVLYMGMNIIICLSLAYFNSFGICMFLWATLTAMCEWDLKRKLSNKELRKISFGEQELSKVIAVVGR